MMSKFITTVISGGSNQEYGTGLEGNTLEDQITRIMWSNPSDTKIIEVAPEDRVLVERLMAIATLDSDGQDRQLHLSEQTLVESELTSPEGNDGRYELRLTICHYTGGEHHYGVHGGCLWYVVPSSPQHKSWSDGQFHLRPIDKKSFRMRSTKSRTRMIPPDAIKVVKDSLLSIAVVNLSRGDLFEESLNLRYFLETELRTFWGSFHANKAA